MRFPLHFSRSVGATPKHALLGSDEPPERKAIGETAAALVLRKDNILICRQFNSLGWPAQRVVVGWIPPADTKDIAPMDFTAYIFDHSTGVWFLMSELTELDPFHLRIVDAPCLLDVPTAGKGGQVEGPQPLEVMLVPKVLAEKMPDGDYTFVMGADVSNSP